ncbi:MAG: lysine--tRNA ligase [Patescibacteria group bacterium]
MEETITSSAVKNVREERLEKLKKIKDLGIDPYPSKITLKGKHISVSVARDLMDKKVLVAGRIWSIRVHGGVTFTDLKDGSGLIQLFFQKKELNDRYDILKLIDTGDFLAVSGTVIKTQAGEISILVDNFQILSKSIRQLPSIWYGLKDTEERYRQRYVDLLLNDELKELFKKKSFFWNSMRQFLIEKGFLEVETPVLENTVGGADANPFTTHHDALNIDLYLRISMGELWQKRLMVAGFDKTFEIGRQFRNEGLSREHLQDYTQMEFYWGYANYEDSMALVEEMYKFVAKETFGKLKFKIAGQKVDLGEKWKKIDYIETIKEKTGVDIINAAEDELKNKLKSLKIKYDNDLAKVRLIDMLWKHVRKEIVGPVFLVGHPVEVSPLAKRMIDKPTNVERYQVIIAGSEMGNGYSELNDPIDQAERFLEQQKLRDEGDPEAQMNDWDFVRALEYGMPPVSGFGVSERLFSFLVDKPIKETVLFPLLRPEKYE